MNSSFPTRNLTEDVLPLAGNGTGFVRGDWKLAFQEAGLRRLEDFFAVSGKPLSKPGLGKRYRAQLELTYADKTCLVFVKRYEG